MKKNKISWSSSRALAQKESHSLLAKILPRYSRGVVVDLGCGDKPYREYVRAKKYIGVDRKNGDIVSDVLKTPLKDNYADTVLSIQVLEHVQDPQQLFKESRRILKPGGYLILTTPMVWPIHDEVDDYWRFTDLGLRHLAKTTGFKVVDCQPMGGFISIIWQMTAVLLERPTYHRGFFRRLLKIMLKPVFWLIQPLIYWLDCQKPIKGLTMSYCLIAQKK